MDTFPDQTVPVGPRRGRNAATALRRLSHPSVPSARRPGRRPAQTSDAALGPKWWVTKTDLTRYIRCPFSFWLLDTGQLSFADSIRPIQAELIDRGVAFHEEIEAQAVPVEETADIDTLFAREVLELYGLPILVNDTLGLRGVPDGVHTEGGALVPIEVKSHRDVRTTDMLELAFYWLLLEPYRTRPKIPPRGVIILRRDGGDIAVELELQPRHFAEVHRLINEVRQVRRHGAQPRFCSCWVCSGPMREQVLRRAHQGHDLTLIWKIGPRLAHELENLGIRRYTDLVDCDQVDLLASLRARKLSVSDAMIQGWCSHAQSYVRARAVLFGTPAQLPRSFIALDLEYSAHTWLTGVCVVDGTRREILQLWADTPAAERLNLHHLARLVDDNPSLPLVTWNGNGADLPELRRTGRRLKLTEVVNSIVTNHLDLFQYTAGALRLPIPSLSLTEVAAYFGVTKLSPVQGGYDAQTRYHAYRATSRGAAKEQLREELLEYNRDDLTGLVAAVEGIRQLVPQSPASSTAAPSAA